MSPVSYTHLDVYKRQVLGWSFSSIHFKIRVYNSNLATRSIKKINTFENSQNVTLLKHIA